MVAGALSDEVVIDAISRIDRERRERVREESDRRGRETTK